MLGYMNKIIRVDLNTNKIKIEIPSNDILHNYVGGIGIGTRVVYDEVPPGVDAFDPENVLVLAVGPLTGTMVPGSARYHIISKSPNTTFTISNADAAGFFGPEFKFAGYDAMIIEGAAEKPVYILINDEKIEILDAEKIWGKDTFETEDAIKKKHNDDKIRVISIGPAGEKLVRYACIVNDKGHVAARGGMGAVMGSKKLKAIAVRGTKSVPVKDARKLIELNKDWREKGQKTGMYKWGTGRTITPYYQESLIPVKNLTTNIFPGWEKLTSEYVRTTFENKKKTCWNCYMAHNRVVKVTEGPYKGFVGEEPEYETFTAFGFNLGVDDPGAVTKIGDLCDRLGMDALQASWIISMIMESYEKGILKKEELGNLDLVWGNSEAILELLKKIAYREDIGDILAEGPEISVERLGRGISKYGVYVKKNMSPKCIDIRGTVGRLFSFAIAHSGPTTEHDPGIYRGGVTNIELGILEPLDATKPEGWAFVTKVGGIRRIFIDSLGICYFPVPERKLKPMLEAYEAVTGQKMSFEEAMNTGEKILNLMRCFNIRHGLTPENDGVSEKLFTAPIDGLKKGVSGKTHLKGMVLEYYQLMGWDIKTGKPTRRTLKKFGLKKAADDLWNNK
jgi:aldehyde:ferredoxin oxidoreductase